MSKITKKYQYQDSRGNDTTLKFIEVEGLTYLALIEQGDSQLEATENPIAVMQIVAELLDVIEAYRNA